jgi:sn-glycerol 3-phosphate transport system substrate-binding protein
LHPILFLVQMDLEDKPSGVSANHLAPMNQIRAVNDEILEAMFAGLMPYDKALQRAEERSNHILTRFIRNNM